ncbi:MAG: hypothetical protein AAGH74_02810 [Pseudomonadota bacterium]
MADLAIAPLFIGTGDLYLHVQMVVYYAAALCLGLVLGYLVWGWRKQEALQNARAEGTRAAERKADAAGTTGEVGRLRTELDICTKARANLETRLEQAQAQLRSSGAPIPAVPEPEPNPEPNPSEEIPEAATKDPSEEEQPSQEPIPSPDSARAKRPLPPIRIRDPETAPEPDDLKQIKGVGVKLEAKLNGLGITQFTQIANWTEDDIATIDDQLNFKGRITRDDWVAQAKRLSESN